MMTQATHKATAPVSPYSSSPVFTALDTQCLATAKDFARSVGPITKGLKIGMELYYAHGHEAIAAVQDTSPEADIFLDLKLYDIPNTVAKGIASLCNRFAPAYINIHASGGLEMMRAARETCDPKTGLLAVTALTSFDQDGFTQAGYSGTIKDQVLRMADNALQANVDGLVCSALEIEPLRAHCGNDFILMVPGIRPAGSASNDQKRVMTPPEALKAGATHLVIGRPITQADDPAQAAADILSTL